MVKSLFALYHLRNPYTINDLLYRLLFPCFGRFVIIPSRLFYLSFRYSSTEYKA